MLSALLIPQCSALNNPQSYIILSTMPVSINAWNCFIDVLFNDKKEVPIELIGEFRRLSKFHRLENYCDYLRYKKLPDTLRENPWEVKWLEELSDVLPRNIQVLVLKGAAARNMGLYTLPLLRETSDLDLFFPNINSFKEQKNVIELLVKKYQTKLPKIWKACLKRLKTVVLKFEDKSIDIHFELFSPLGNAKNPIIGTCRKNKILEEEIIKRAASYNDLQNIKKMSAEDYWLYSVFHFLKDFPIADLRLMLDSSLILKDNKSTLEKLELHSRQTNQLYLYNLGVYLLSQLNNNLSRDKLKINQFYCYIFKIKKIKDSSKYSFKSRIMTEFSKGLLSAKGDFILSFLFCLLYLIKNEIITSDIAEEKEKFTLRNISNFTTKLFYTVTKLRNILKKFCLRIAGVEEIKLDTEAKIIHTEKKLITLEIQALKFTFNIPKEFYDDLERIWKGFLSNEHKDKIINVEKVDIDLNENTSYEITYSESNIYLKLSQNVFCKVKLKGSGTIFARNFWDVRSFALDLFRASTLSKEDMILLHSGAVKINNQTLIFPGGSSTGKTTFFNLLIKNGAFGINDDTVLLKKENNFWYVYPTPFMSRKQEPILCERSIATGILDLKKVLGGHEISSLEKDNALAILLNNSKADFIIDDAGYVLSAITSKIIDFSKQLSYFAEVKFSLEEEETLFELIKEWLYNPEKTYNYGNFLKNLIELRGNSMEPVFKDGDILIVKEILPNKLKLKDIICFRNDVTRLPTIHRIKYLIRHSDKTTVITKGDNSIYEDSPQMFKSNQRLLKVVENFSLRRNLNGNRKS